MGKTRAGSEEALSYVELKQLKFALGLQLLSEHSAYPDTSEAIRIVLPAGLSWGDRPPSAQRRIFTEPSPWTFEPTAQSCEVSGQVATCRAEGVPSGTQVFGWIFDAAASKPGTYKIIGEVVPPSDGQNRPPRGASTPVRAEITLVIGPRTGAVRAGGVVLTRPRPSFVRAMVEVTQGGVDVQPKAASCNGSFPGKKVTAGALALFGSVDLYVRLQQREVRRQDPRRRALVHRRQDEDQAEVLGPRRPRYDAQLPQGRNPRAGRSLTAHR